MARYIQPKQFSKITIGTGTPPSNSFESEPRLYFPINSETEGLHGIKFDGSQISGTWTSGDKDWGTGKWGVTASGSVNVHGGSEYYSNFANVASGTADVNTGTGTVCLWFTPEFDSGDLSEDKYLIESNNFIRFYYDYSNTRFLGDFFDGSGWGTRVVSGSSLPLVSGTSIHVGLGYNNQRGAYLYLSGTIEGALHNTWTQQTLPDAMYIGCVSGSAINKADGFIDDIKWYDSVVTSSNMTKVVNKNYDSN